MHFSAFLSLVFASSMLSATAGPVRVAPSELTRDTAASNNGKQGVSFKLVTGDQFMNWLATTDANITFVGPPPGTRALNMRQATTMVTYCTNRIDDICGGTCQVYNGGATCLAASGTSCIAATTNVGFCDKGGCGGSCNELSSCGTPLSNGFCDTPGTNSILVGA
ncbi:hypothetical protein C8R44DRAFT_319962 [Mycena epipterygia]|nr:hypothetical protein C8R44DRAFT_319954 [Mycena epipterygia]KAJ7107783.1 hypothetical protein C8R44DRAFT_319962 [Mycena epipterygia]